MEEQQYMEERFDDQYQWFEKKSAWNQKRYKFIKQLVILTAALIPFLTGFITDNSLILKIVVGAMGVIIAFSENILSFNKYHENWVQYRTTAESLKRERFLYLTEAGLYEEAANPFRRFVEQVETLLGEENSAWIQYVKKKDSEA
jgi:hypothetical protein